jgi:hypothetical protein
MCRLRSALLMGSFDDWPKSFASFRASDCAGLAIRSGICVALSTLEPKLDERGQWLGAQNRSQIEMEGYTMIKDDRDILELLKEELSFIEVGGYGRSVRTPWLSKSAFQDSLTCINYADPDRAHPCNECHLIDFVASEHHSGDVLCHFIALNEAGETIEDLEAQDNQARLEATVKQWMRVKIKQIEDQRVTFEARKQPIS